MEDFSFQIDSQIPPSKMMAKLPAGLKVAMAQGFSVITELPEAKRTRLVELVSETVIARGPVDEEQAETELGLTRAQMSGTFAAASFMVMSMTTGPTMSATDFVDAASEAAVINKADRDAALALGQIVEAQRPFLRRTVERATLADAVLPALTSVQWTVDLRLGFEKEKVEAAVPIAMVYLNTDRHGQAICFQISRPQLEKLVRDLKKALSKMDIAEEYAEQRKSR